MHMNLVGQVVLQCGATDVHPFDVPVVKGEIEAREVGRVQHAAKCLDSLKPHRSRSLAHVQRLRELVQVRQFFEAVRTPEVPEHLRGLIAHLTAGFGQRHALPRVFALGGVKLRLNDAFDPRQVPPFRVQCLIVSFQQTSAPFPDM